jgi:hypothetical protein
MRFFQLFREFLLIAAHRAYTSKDAMLVHFLVQTRLLGAVYSAGRSRMAVSGGGGLYPVVCSYVELHEKRKTDKNNLNILLCVAVQVH